MDKTRPHHNALRLYPPVSPFDQGWIDVSPVHSIYVEQSGNPNGIPVIVLHGGPGGGANGTMRRYFDPKHYRIILFDQRGAGRSRPHAEIEENTTWDLVSDIEMIRTRFDLGPSVVFGGSWGATLALIYAQAYPDAVSHLVLRGVFTMTQAELDWFYTGGAGRFFPEAWARFTSILTPEEQGDIMQAYHSRIFSDDPAIANRAATEWTMWENTLSSIESMGQSHVPNAQFAKAFARIEAHYFKNMGFLRDDQAIMNNLDKIQHIPTHIVQGRYDMVCPPHTAYALSKGLARAHLHMVRLAGHAMSETGIVTELLAVMKQIALNHPKPHNI